MNKETIRDRVKKSMDSHEGRLIAAANDIWDHPEVNFHEDYSSGVLKRLLKEEGFSITEPLADLPNTFRAEYGSGSPVIGFLCEFDALSALSQKAGCTVKDPLEPGKPGHGCGHNLIGVGSAAAAIAVKELMEDGLLSGKVVVFGCPAEETGSAKAFMAKEGCFDGLDVAFSWHPWDYNGIWPGGSLANVKLIFRFKGRAAHAAAAPHLGRSALDALELMNMGVQFLREHIPEDSRIHYAVTNAGGASPNVVQAYAEAVYLIRSPRNDDLEDIKNRVIDCATGAAIMTGTESTWEFVKGCSGMMPNTALETLLMQTMGEIGVPEFTEEEKAFAGKLHESLESPESTLAQISRLADARTRAKVMQHQGEPIYAFLAPHTPTDSPIVKVSTDVGDVSHITPVGQICTSAWAADTPAHTWQVVAIGKSSIAHKAMLFASRTLAEAAARVMTEPELLAEAREEFEERAKTANWASPIPDGIRPVY